MIRLWAECGLAFWGKCGASRVHLKISIFIHNLFAGGISDLWVCSTTRSFIRMRGRVVFRPCNIFNELQKLLVPGYAHTGSVKSVWWFKCECVEGMSLWKLHTWGQFLLLQGISSKSDHTALEKPWEKALWVNIKLEILFLQPCKMPGKMSLSIFSLAKVRTQPCVLIQLQVAFHNLQMDGPKITFPQQPGWHS